jgi:hypothetical protein
VIRVPERGVSEPPRDYRTVTELLAEAAELDLQLRDGLCAWRAGRGDKGSGGFGGGVGESAVTDLDARCSRGTGTGGSRSVWSCAGRARSPASGRV